MTSKFMIYNPSFKIKFPGLIFGSALYLSLSLICDKESFPISEVLIYLAGLNEVLHYKDQTYQCIKHSYDTKRNYSRLQHEVLSSCHCTVITTYSMYFWNLYTLYHTQLGLWTSTIQGLCYKQQTPWPESMDELYRPSDDCLLTKLVSTLADGGCYMVSVTDPYSRIVEFLDRSRYFFFQVALQLYSWGWVDPVLDPLLLRKSGSAENRTYAATFVPPSTYWIP
jgi:hypothetical protein